MIKMQELDQSVSIRDQLAEESDEPVVLLNVIRVAPEQSDELIAAWTDDVRFFKAQSGVISTQLHRGIAGSGTFLNYAVWQSVGQFRAAFTNPELQAKLEKYPDSSTTTPHLFRKLAVDGLCVA